MNPGLITLCFASNNDHKLTEVRSLLAADFLVSSLKDIGCYDELPETKASIEGNARQKAEYVFNKYGVPCFADDTGLEVEVLNNAPGVYSARYAGDHKSSDDNVALLLRNLSGIKNRSARFRTVITLATGRAVHDFEGILTGEITQGKRGGGGFGYDPVFQPSGSEKTLAEMTLPQKNAISHRAIAVRKLADWLRTSKHLLLD